MKNSINDDEAEVLLAGRTPEGRPDFDELAASIASFRSATFEMVPRPSAVLAARLGLPQEELVTATSTAASTGRLAANCPDAAFAARVPRSSAMTRMIERVSDLSLAAKIAAGMGVLALGITVAGAAHALPGGLQNAFDNFVSTVISVEGNDEVVIVDEHMTGGEVDPAEQTLPDDGDEVDPAEQTLPDDGDEVDPAEQTLPDDGDEVDPAEQTLPDDGDEANSSLMDDVEVGDETEIGTDSERDDAGEEPGTGAGTSGSGT
jgi:hypothetical protein